MPTLHCYDVACTPQAGQCRTADLCPSTLYQKSPLPLKSVTKRCPSRLYQQSPLPLNAVARRCPSTLYQQSPLPLNVVTNRCPPSAVPTENSASQPWSINNKAQTTHPGMVCLGISHRQEFSALAHGCPLPWLLTLQLSTAQEEEGDLGHICMRLVSTINDVIQSLHGLCRGSMLTHLHSQLLS